MNELDDVINQVKTTRLDEFSVDVLETMSKEIEKKQKNLLDKALKIKKIIDGINIHQNYYGHSGILPEDFSTPLKKILTQQREMKSIDKFNRRYKIELKRIDSLINEKKMENSLILKLGNKTIVKIKDIVLMFLIMFVLSLLIFELSFPTISEDVLLKLFIADTICCLIFLTNFFYELKVSPSKKWYWKTHWLDFITSIPIPNAGILRAGRISRLIRLTKLFRIFRFLKFFRLIFFFWRGMNDLEDVFDVHLARKMLFITIFISFIGAILIFQIEKLNNGTYLESLWWSVFTIFGSDFQLHLVSSNYGKIISIFLMLVGMIFIGVLTATLTTLMVGDESEKSIDALRLYLDKRLNKNKK